MMTKEHKRKIGLANEGHPVSTETRHKISKANKGQKRTSEQRKRISQSLKGRNLSEEHKRKIGLAGKGKALTKKHKQALLKANIGRHHSKKTRRKISQSLKGHPGANKGKHFSEDIRKKQSLACLSNWQNPEYRENQIKAIIKGCSAQYSYPTKPERRLRNGLNKMFPGEYKFVGDGKVWIGYKNPDFINVNSQKKIIELFGDFWHGKKYRSITFGDNSSNKEHENRRIKHFAKYGYKTLIVWECELKSIRQLKRKLVGFHNV